MTCPACGHSNRPSAKFCEECGTRLGRAATPAPGVRDPRAYTPNHLAEKILTTRAALEGERKQVTVLFVDVKGSMHLAAQVDPEAWHRILDQFFAILAEGVHRYEGTINQFTGDGIMALFGAPIAHEDHAHRACNATLDLSEALATWAAELRREQGLNFSVRMGLNSGEVVVGRIGDDLRMDYTAQGHTVGLAARMESLAEPGRVYLTEHTAALVEGFYRLDDLGLFTVPGAREQLRVFALAGRGPLRSRFDASRARGLSRFVGREEETLLLDDALARAMEGAGQVVGVVAEPGVGKTRLCWEFVQRCRARGVTVHEGHAVPHGRSVPYLVALDLARSYFGISPEDGDRAARRKIAGTLVLIDPDLGPALPLVFEFLGVPDPARPSPPLEPAARQRELASVMRRLVRTQSQREPIVTLVEDLHWIDGGSESFLRNLVDALDGTRALLIFNFRPEYPAGWLARPAYREIALRPLDGAAATALLDELLGTDPSLEGLAPQIAERTAGNPFFLEEVVRTLVETGRLRGTRGAFRLVGPVEDLEIPATVRDVLAARIDRLAEREKGVLGTAAVVGKEFSRNVLARVAELPERELAPALDALVQAEFLDERPPATGADLAFTHPLTQEVAYRMQLSERRATVHAAVARAILAVDADRLDERAALLAHHYESAGDRIEAARWSQRAAEWVGPRDFTEALGHWRRVRSLLVGQPETPELDELRLVALRMILNYGVRVGLDGGEAGEMMLEVQRLGERTGDVRARILVLAGPAALRVMSGDLEGTIEPLLEGLRLAEQVGNPGARLAMSGILVIGLFSAGRLREALRVADHALAEPPDDPRLGSDVFGFTPYSLVLGFRSMILREMGDLAGSTRDCELSGRIAEAVGDLERLIGVYAGRAYLARARGDGEAALGHARRAVEVAERLASPLAQAQSYEALGIAHLAREEWDAAAAALEHGVSMIRTHQVGGGDEPFYLAELVEAHVGRGDLVAARARADEALAQAHQRGSSFAETEALVALARVLARAEPLDRAAAEAALDRAAALGEEVGLAAMVPVMHEIRAEVLRRSGDVRGAAALLARAAELHEGMGAPREAARLRTAGGGQAAATPA
jgi:class 3 adenylate cyclase/tetratricopeptide (TPR) repeat protein